MIGTLRWDCLDHVIVLSEQHLRRILRKYLEYYHGSRTHLALDKDTPDLRQGESADGGKVIDQIPGADCEVDTDQRGVARPQGDPCDVGAFELEVGP